MESTVYRLKLTGMSPLIMNSNAALARVEREDKGRDPAQYEREHYLDKCYTSPSGQLVIPSRAIKKSLVEACKFLPEKPRGVSFKSYGPFVQSATVVPEDAVLNVQISQVVPLTMVVNLDPSKGQKGPRGPRTRPSIPLPWAAEAIILVVDPILKLEVLERIAERAGKQVGLLDGRSIDFGRCNFEVFDE